jgi:hypothetical protein
VTFCIYLSIYLSTALQPFFGPWPLFSSLILYTVGRTPWTGDQPVARPLPIHKTTQTQNKRTRTSMPQVGFELTIPVFERAKTVHALDRAVTVIGNFCISLYKCMYMLNTCLFVIDRSIDNLLNYALTCYSIYHRSAALFSFC